jgi:DNA-binding transcriptional MerR regulator
LDYVEYRVDELASEVGISVEVLRSYQSKGLLPPPRHRGRAAFYDHHHLERLRTIRALKAQGHSLRAIATLLDEARLPPLAALGPGDADEHDALTLVELAERTRVPPAVLRSFEASRLLRPRLPGVDRPYTAADAQAVRLLLSLVGTGVPMEEFMRVARIQIEAADDAAQGAVELFMQYVREPLCRSGLPQKQEAEHLVASFGLLVRAASGLVSHNMERALLDALRAALAERGNAAERTVLARETTPRPVVA